MRWLALSLTLLTACSDKTVDSGDSVDSSAPCELCQAELSLSYADGRDSFSLSFDDAASLEVTRLSCPDGQLETNIAFAELVCEGSTARLITEAISWDGTLYVTDSEQSYTVEPTLGALDETNCYSCYSSSVVIGG